MEESVRLRSNSGNIRKRVVWKTEKAVSGERSAYIFRNVELYILCDVDSCILNYTASPTYYQTQFKSTRLISSSICHPSDNVYTLRDFRLVPMRRRGLSLFLYVARGHLGVSYQLLPTYAAQYPRRAKSSNFISCWEEYVLYFPL